jgi:hypothetical protein
MGEPALSALDRLQATFDPVTNRFWHAQICLHQSAVLDSFGRSEEARAVGNSALDEFAASEHPHLAQLVRELRTEIDEHPDPIREG